MKKNNIVNNIISFLFLRWPLAVIFGVWLLFSSPYVFKGLVPFPSRYLVSNFPPWSAQYAMPIKNNAMPDVITQMYPWKRFTMETWKSGHIPLWNPYVFSGTPHGANYQTAIFSPFNALFLFMSEIKAWSILVLLQPLLAGICMYVYLTSLRRSKHAVTLGSISFMFCGFMVVWMAYATLGYAALWLPLIFFSVHKQFQKRSWWYGVLLTIGIALSFVSGHFQISLYVLCVSICYALYEGWRLGEKKQIFVNIFFIFLGVMLVTPQLFITYDAYITSVRSSLFGSGEVIPFHYLITMIAPDFYGNPVTRNDWFGHYAEWASYIGVAPLLLAMYAVIQKRDKQILFFVLLGVVAILLATPTPLNALLFALKIPAVSTSAASRIILIASFCLSVLASFGFDAFAHGAKANKRSFMFLCVLVFGFFILVWVTLLFGKTLHSDALFIAKRNFILPTGLALVTFFLITIGFVKKKYIYVLASSLLVIVTVFDLLRYSTKWMPFDPDMYMYPSMNVISFLQKNIGENRVFGNFSNELATSFHIPSLEGYDALYQKRYGELIQSVQDGKISAPEKSIVSYPKYGAHNEKMLELLGVRYYLHRQSDGRFPWEYPYWLFPQYTSVYKDSYYEVLENSIAFPKAYLAFSYLLETNDQKIIDLMYEPSTDLRKSIVLEQKPKEEPVAGQGRIHSIKTFPNEIFYVVDTNKPALLFISDVYDPGWKATIDGVSSNILRANYAFRAISIPAGSHSVRMYYWPSSIYRGLVLFFITFLFLIFGSVYKIYHEYRHI